MTQLVVLDEQSVYRSLYCSIKFDYLKLLLSGTSLTYYYHIYLRNVAYVLNYNYISMPSTYVNVCSNNVSTAVLIHALALLLLLEKLAGEAIRITAAHAILPEETLSASTLLNNVHYILVLF